MDIHREGDLHCVWQVKLRGGRDVPRKFVNVGMPVQSGLACNRHEEGEKVSGVFVGDP